MLSLVTNRRPCLYGGDVGLYLIYIWIEVLFLKLIDIGNICNIFVLPHEMLTGHRIYYQCNQWSLTLVALTKEHLIAIARYSMESAKYAND